MGESWAIWLTETLEWIRGAGFIGYVWFIVLYVILCALFLPGSILTLGAGAVYGWPLGTLLVAIGSALAASINFFLSRYLARGWIERRLESRPRFRSLAHKVAEKGWPLIMLSRLSPVFPHSIISYAAGLTRINYFTFFGASFLGFLPLSAAYSYAGDVIGQVTLLRSHSMMDDPASAAIWIAGLVMTFAVTIASAVFVARAFRDAPAPEATQSSAEPEH